LLIHHCSIFELASVIAGGRATQMPGVVETPSAQMDKFSFEPASVELISKKDDFRRLPCTGERCPTKQTASRSI
jgi:hypothetical protein